MSEHCWEMAVQLSEHCWDVGVQRRLNTAGCRRSVASEHSGTGLKGLTDEPRFPKLIFIFNS